MKKFIYFIMLLGATLSSVSCQNEEPKKDREKERIVSIYALNDFHGAYLYDSDYEQIGLSKIGEFIDNKRSENEDTIVISSGDMFQGGAESNITYGEVVIESMNALGFDAMTIGNHEFDWGEERLKEMTDLMDFPLLGINIFYSKDNTRPSYLSPSVTINLEDLKVGIIGSIMPNIGSSILATISNNYLYESSLDLIEEESKRLKEEEGCEVVILSSHDGSYNYYADLALDGYIDALFLGHDHNYKEGTFINGVPYIEGACNGEYLSNINLTLNLDENNEYKVVNATSENIETWGNESFKDNSSKVDEVYNKYKESIENTRDEVLYTFDKTISRRDFGNFMAKALLDYAYEYYKNDGYNVVRGMVNTGGIRSSIPKGDFTYGDLIKVYPFENVLCLIKVKAENIETVPNAGYGYSDYTLIKGDEEYLYVATIDYVAYGSSYSVYPEIIASSIMCRDVVANELRKGNF